MTDSRVASLAALLRTHPMFGAIYDDTASPTQREMDEHDTKQRQQRADGLAEWLIAHNVTVIQWGAASEPPRCTSHLWAVSCGHTSCPLHGAWEAKWSGRGPSAERDADFQRMALGSRLGEPSPEGPWRIVDEGSEDEYWMVVTGDGKPRCAHCGTYSKDYDETKFGSNVKAEAEAVRDALNTVAVRGSSQETPR